MERRLIRAASALLATVLVAAGCACGGADGGSVRPLRVLFVGNSLTATNDLPAAVRALAAEAGRRPVETRTVAPGGVSLEEHWRSTGAREALAEGPWDAIVLQQGPSSLPDSRAHLRTWSRRWADEVRAHGARPALLGVWSEAERRQALPASIASYTAAAGAADAILLPAGAAWRAAWRREPGLELTDRTASTRACSGPRSPRSSCTRGSPVPIPVCCRSTRTGTPRPFCALRPARRSRAPDGDVVTR